MLHVSRNLVLESNCGLKDAKVALLGVPFDSTSTYRVGSRAAPLELRKEFLELEKDGGFFDIPFYDAGNVEVVHGNARETLRMVEHTVKSIYEENPGVFLITLGGEHTITYPVVKNLEKGDLTVVSLDAHMDLKDDYMGERWCHASVMRRVSELKGGLVEIGVRSYTGDESAYAKKKGIRYCGREKKEFNGILKNLAGKRVYITLDFDVVTPEVASGVSNPEPNGITLDELNSIYNTLIQRSRVAGMDIVEVNPLYDKTATTVAAAKTMLDVVMGVTQKRR